MLRTALLHGWLKGKGFHYKVDSIPNSINWPSTSIHSAQRVPKKARGEGQLKTKLSIEARPTPTPEGSSIVRRSLSTQLQDQMDGCAQLLEVC